MTLIEAVISSRLFKTTDMRTDIILLVTSLISVAWTRPRARDDIEPLIASDQCLVELGMSFTATRWT